MYSEEFVRSGVREIARASSILQIENVLQWSSVTEKEAKSMFPDLICRAIRAYNLNLVQELAPHVSSSNLNKCALSAAQSGNVDALLYIIGMNRVRKKWNRAGKMFKSSKTVIVANTMVLECVVRSHRSIKFLNRVSDLLNITKINLDAMESVWPLMTFKYLKWIINNFSLSAETTNKHLLTFIDISMRYRGLQDTMRWVTTCLHISLAEMISGGDLILAVCEHGTPMDLEFLRSKKYVSLHEMKVRAQNNPGVLHHLCARRSTVPMEVSMMWCFDNNLDMVRIMKKFTFFGYHHLWTALGSGYFLLAQEILDTMEYVDYSDIPDTCMRVENGFSEFVFANSLFDTEIISLVLGSGNLQEVKKFCAEFDIGMEYLKKSLYKVKCPSVALWLLKTYDVPPKFIDRAMFLACQKGDFRIFKKMADLVKHFSEDVMLMCFSASVLRRNCKMSYYLASCFNLEYRSDWYTIWKTAERHIKDPDVARWFGIAFAT